MNNKDRQSVSGAFEMRIRMSTFLPRAPPIAPDHLQSESLGLVREHVHVLSANK
jgi:hypothetical protein